MYAGEIPEDSIQVIEACHVGNECMVEVQFPEGKHLSSVEVEETNTVAIMHRIGKHAAQCLFPGVDTGLLSERVCAAISGKSAGGVDDNCSFDDSPDIDEEALIEEKTEYEKKFILKFRSIFSESLKPDNFIKAPPMEINLRNNPNAENDPSLYRFKPRSVPA